MAHWALYDPARGLVVDCAGGQKDENSPLT
jgi:hypothetical protein